MNFYSMNICNLRTQYGMDLTQTASKGYWWHFRFLRADLCQFYACPIRIAYTDCQQRLLVAFQVSSCRFVSILCLPHTHRRSQGGQRDHGPSKYLENIVIVCLEKRFSKQNSLFRLKSNVLSPPKFSALPNSWAGYATAHAFFLRGPVLVLLIIKLCRHSTSLL